MAKTKEQNELVALVALLLVAALTWYFYYGRGRSRNAEVAVTGPFKEIDAIDYGRIIIDLSKTQNTEYKSSGRNIFVIGAMPVEPTQQAKPKDVFVVYNQPQPPAPPPPATLPMVFFGYGMLPAGGARQAFLKDENGDDVHIVSEGDLLLNHFRILHIGNEKLDFEDINTGQKGSKTLEAQPPA